MEFIQTAIKEVLLIKPKVFSDSRGFFLESYKKSVFKSNGINDEFAQDNHSRSSYGVLRGLHYQLFPLSQGKLVRCIRGKIFDVAVDIRPGSPTFGKWVGYELSHENFNMLYIPSGFAHGFLTLSEVAEVLYKSTNEYSPSHERGILYNDPAIGIDWPKIEGELIISSKDQEQPILAEADLS